MQISQTRAKFQIQGLGNGLPGLLCILCTLGLLTCKRLAICPNRTIGCNS